MSQIVADRVQERSITVGGGPYTLSGAIDGFRTVASIPNILGGDTFEYYAENVDITGSVVGDWETGLATWDSSLGTLLRTTIYSSSNGGLPVVWTTGVRHIALTITAETITRISLDFINMATSLMNTQTLIATNLV
jgi:hypothetical protein